MKLYRFIDQCLETIGVDKVFGIPGSLIMPIWQNLTGKEIVLCSHEQEASYVACAYAKASLKPVCVVTTGGPGVLNCVSGVASANIDSVPMIYISGRTPKSKEGAGLRQEEGIENRLYDSTKLLSAITKRSIVIEELNTAPTIIWETIKYAIVERAGSVHISIPIDFQNAEIKEIPLELEHGEKNFSKELLDKLDLNHFVKPLFIIGWGCWMSSATREVYQLSEKVNAPILVTSKGYCCIDYDHSMFLGKLGYGYTDILDNFLLDYNPDVIIAFGTSLGDKDIDCSAIKTMLMKTSSYLISNDCSFMKSKKYKTITIEAKSIRKYIACIYEKTASRNLDIRLCSEIKNIKELITKHWESLIAENDLMAKCINGVNELVNSSVVVTADAGNHLADAGVLINPKNIGSMFLDVGVRAMGNGLCSTVGFAIANSDKCYLAITGDGCMLMNGNVMHLIHKKELPIIIIVFNNESLGRVRVGQSIMNEYRGTDILDVDYVKYANSLGISAIRVKDDNELVLEINRGLSEKKPLLIEIKSDKDEIPLAIRGNVY